MCFELFEVPMFVAMFCMFAFLNALLFVFVALSKVLTFIQSELELQDVSCITSLYTTLDHIKGHFPLIHQWFSMVIGGIPETYQRFVNGFLLTIAVNGFIKGLSHKDFNVKGVVNVLFFSVLNC